MVIKKKSDNNWEYCIYIGQNENGKKKYKRKCGFKTKKECIAEASLYENKINPNRKTLEDVFWLYIKNKENRGVRITTIQTLKGYFRIINCNFKFSNSYIDLITSDHINDFIYGDYFSKLSSQFKINLITFLKSIFIFALKRKFIKINIFNDIEIIKKDYRIRKIWTETELKQYLPILKNFKYFDIVLLALETGMRKGEILGLMWDCIDFDKGTLLVEKNLVKAEREFHIHTPKTRAGVREILLFKDSLNMLKNRYKSRVSEFVFHEIEYPFKPVCPVKLGVYFTRFLKHNNIKPIHFHDLRHIHATFLLQNKVDYKILSKRLGHTNIAFTLQTYTHVLPENERYVLSNLPSMI